MSRHKFVYVSVALLVILGTLVAGCPSAPPSPTAAATTAPAAATTAPTKPAAVATAAPAVVTPATAPTNPAAAAPVAQPAVAGTYTGPLAQQQVLRLYTASEPPTLDPSKAQDSASNWILDSMYEGLTRFRPDLSVEPAIAESWQISADGKTYTFKLRESKFSDGTALTAKDFEYSWKRMLDPRTASPYANILAAEVVGAADFNAAKVPTDTAKLPQLEAAVGIKAVDDKTLQVTLKAPATYFLWITSLWNAVPLSRTAIEKGGDRWTEPPNHVSNGPFILKEWKHQAQVVLEPNPNYWDKKPTLTQIVYNIISEPQAALQAYKNNELDILGGTIPQADRPLLRADPVYGKEVVSGSQLATYYFGFNVTKAPFTGENGKLVRQALSQAVDRKVLVEVINKGVGTPAGSFIPPGMPGHQPEIGFQFDPAAAKATLQKAGYADGAALGTIELVYNSSSSHKPIIEFVADQLKKNLGVDADIKAMEWGAYLDLLGKDSPQIWRLGWNADYPHPNNFLKEVFHSKSGMNYFKFNNAEFDRLVTQAAAEADPRRQEQLYNQAQQILVDEAPALFLYWYGTFALVKPWVKDVFQTSKESQPGQFFFRLTKIAQH